MDKSKLQLPEKLEPFREQFEKSTKPFIEIKGRKAATLPWESKIGGNPYLPVGYEYPVDKNKKPMRLLSQINFSEVPHISSYPEKGILQFYISAHDDLYGVDFKDLSAQNNFKVIYVPKYSKDETNIITDFSFVGEPGQYCLPFDDEVKIYFDVGYQPVATGDFQFQKVFGKEVSSFLEDILDDEDEIDSFFDDFSFPGHRIGGYAYFTQSDPRENGYEEYTELLLQIDSDNDLGIMWGDCGVANFFIREEDLKKLDFSKVLYTYDCC